MNEENKYEVELVQAPTTQGWELCGLRLIQGEIFFCN